MACYRVSKTEFLLDEVHDKYLDINDSKKYDLINIQTNVCTTYKRYNIRFILNDTDLYGCLFQYVVSTHKENTQNMFLEMVKEDTDNVFI